MQTTDAHLSPTLFLCHPHSYFASPAALPFLLQQDSYRFLHLPLLLHLPFCIQAEFLASSFWPPHACHSHSTFQERSCLWKVFMPYPAPCSPQCGVGRTAGGEEVLWTHLEESNDHHLSTADEVFGVCDVVQQDRFLCGASCAWKGQGWTEGTQKAAQRDPPAIHPQNSLSLTSSHTPLSYKLNTTLVQHSLGKDCPRVDPAFPQARRKSHLLCDAELPSTAYPAGNIPASRTMKRHEKTEVSMVPTCPLLAMPLCTLGKRHVSCCGGLKSLPRWWEHSSWPGVKPSVPEVNVWLGENPSLLCRHRP